MTDRYLSSLDSHESSENDENNLFSLSSDSFLKVTAFKRASRMIIDDDKNLTSLSTTAVAHDTVHKITCFSTIMQINFKKVDTITDEREFTFCVMPKAFKLNDDLNVFHTNILSSLISYFSD